EVEDGARALEIFMREPDAWTGAFVDFLLPDTHGDELIERLLALRPDLPVVLMTGDWDPDTDRRASERQLTILRKPFPLERVRPLAAARLRRAEDAAQEQSACAAIRNLERSAAKTSSGPRPTRRRPIPTPPCAAPDTRSATSCNC